MGTVNIILNSSKDTATMATVLSSLISQCKSKNYIRIKDHLQCRSKRDQAKVDLASKLMALPVKTIYLEAMNIIIGRTYFI